MEKKKKTKYITITTAVVWALTVAFELIRFEVYWSIFDILFVIMALFIFPVSLTWISWMLKLLIDKLRKRNTKWTTVFIPMALLLLIPTIIISVWDIFFSTGWFAGLVGYMLTIFVTAPVGILLIAAFVVRIRRRIKNGKTNLNDEG